MELGLEQRSLLVALGPLQTCLEQRPFLFDAAALGDVSDRRRDQDPVLGFQ
jgi:hypothetical protein